MKKKKLKDNAYVLQQVINHQLVFREVIILVLIFTSITLISLSIDLQV